MAITISNWYREYRTSYPPEIHQAGRRDLDYPLAVLLPVIMELIFPPVVEDSINLAHLINRIQQNLFHILLGEESIMIFYNPTLAP